MTFVFLVTLRECPQRQEGLLSLNAGRGVLITPHSIGPYQCVLTLSPHNHVPLILGNTHVLRQPSSSPHSAFLTGPVTITVDYTGCHLHNVLSDGCPLNMFIVQPSSVQFYIYI